MQDVTRKGREGHKLLSDVWHSSLQFSLFFSTDLFISTVFLLKLSEKSNTFSIKSNTEKKKVKDNIQVQRTAIELTKGRYAEFSISCMSLMVKIMRKLYGISYYDLHISVFDEKCTLGPV